LRHILTVAIESLKPGANVSRQANVWRMYRVLSQRYVEQFAQREVATNLGLSTRHVARLESEALRALSDVLWSRWRRPGAELGDVVPSVSSPSAADAEQELDWLKRSCPIETLDAAEVLQAALEVVAPLAHALHTEVECTSAGDPPRLVGQPMALRQTLLNLLTAAIRSAPRGRVCIQTRAQAEAVWIEFHPVATGLPVTDATEKSQESLEMARQLIGPSGGSLDVLPGAGPEEPFRARLVLPAAEQVAILVIDDNVDALHLLERYLAGSRYRFHGTSDPEQALALAGELAPQIIVLDIMLPGLDGWELLGRLHEHPQTRETPVIICTIMPQEDLAAALGAAALIRKPITQLAFLAALDAQLGRLSKE